MKRYRGTYNGYNKVKGANLKTYELYDSNDSDILEKANYGHSKKTRIARGEGRWMHRWDTEGG